MYTRLEMVPRQRRTSWAAVVSALAVAALPASADQALRLRPRPGDSVRFYLVRHGESLTNLPHAPGGKGEDLDHLTARGRDQARQTGRALAGLGLARIVTSPAQRARETTDEIKAVLGPNVQVRQDPRLAQLAIGKRPDGHHFTWEQRVADWKAGRDPQPPEGESLAELRDRVAAALNDLADEAHAGKGPQDVLVVAHSEVVAAALALAKDKPPARETLTGVHNASVTVIDLDRGGKLRVVAEDRVPWLR